MQFIGEIVSKALRSATKYALIPITASASLLSALFMMRSAENLEKTDAKLEKDNKQVSANDSKSIFLRLNVIAEKVAEKPAPAIVFSNRNKINGIIKWYQSQPNNREDDNDKLIQALNSLPDDLCSTIRIKM